MSYLHEGLNKGELQEIYRENKLSKVLPIN